MKNFFISIGSLLLILVALVCTHLVYLYTHREFNPDDFAYDISKIRVNISQPNAKLKEQTSHYLDQRYLYLGRGKQMTAYESEDHLYVIKFFNPRPPLKQESFSQIKKLKRFCTLKWLSSAYFKREERLAKLFKRYGMAFEELPQETGLVYVHLSPSTVLDQYLEVIGKDNKTYHIHLASTPFVLQKKAQLAGTYISNLLNQGDREGAKLAFDQLKDLFVIRTGKGFTDRIQTLHNNYGFVDGRAIQIDVGRLWRDETLKKEPQPELDRIFSNICSTWPDLEGG